MDQKENIEKIKHIQEETLEKLDLLQKDIHSVIKKHLDIKDKVKENAIKDDIAKLFQDKH